MNYQKLTYLAEDLQRECDNMAYIILKEREEVSLYSLLQECCDFNVFYAVKRVEWMFGKRCINFLVKNTSQIKRRFTLPELYDFCEQFRLKSVFGEIKDFEHFKRIKIKNYED